jgi:hypothetical protein
MQEPSDLQPMILVVALVQLALDLTLWISGMLI